MPSWIGPWEIAIVLVLALLIFGPKKLPDLGSSLGRSISGFKRGLKDTKDDVQSALREDVTSTETTTASAEAVSAVDAEAAPAVNAEAATQTPATATSTQPTTSESTQS